MPVKIFALLIEAVILAAGLTILLVTSAGLPPVWLAVAAPVAAVLVRV